MQRYEYLGKPLQIGSLTIKNRFCMAPVGGGQHHLPGGGLKDKTIQYLVERANAYGTKIFAQITMGLGRNYPNLPAPSSVHVFRHPGEVSPELTHDQIKSKIESVIKAGKIAQASVPRNLWHRNLQAVALLSMRLATASRSAQFSTPYGTAMKSATTFNQGIGRSALYKSSCNF